MGIEVLKVTEDARERAPKEATTPFLDELTSPRGPVLQECHDLGEEVQAVSVIFIARLRGSLLPDGAQGLVGSHPAGLEHRGMLGL